MYEDEEDNYNYEKGMYSTINFEWSNSTRNLKIRERQGNFPGMLKQRKFRIVFVSKSHQVGYEATDHVDKIVTYKGKEVEINF